MAPKISVIVPVYNGAKWIENCIKNVFAQTFNDWELIIVNDGSIDDTDDFLKHQLPIITSELSINNSISIIKKENGGVSSARNIGIDNAKGEYIAFIDVDDAIEPTYLENLSKGLGYDMVVTGFCYDNTPQSPIQKSCNTKSEISASLDDFLNTDHFCFPWARLFKTSIIKEHDIRFDTNMRFAEDHVFNWTYIRYINSLYIDSSTCYHKTSDERSGGYNLSYDEMEYIDRSLFELKQKLEYAYQTEIKPAANTFCHILFCKDFLTEHTCSFYADYYKRFHPVANEQEVYDYIANNIFHPGIQLVKHGKYTYRQMRKFLDEPWKLFKNTRIKSRWLIPLVKLI